MTLKEKPLIDAGSKGAGVPYFFFAGPFAAGFFGMVVAAFLGAVCYGVPGALFAGGDNEALLNAILIGSFVAMAIGMVANLFQLIQSLGNNDLRGDRFKTFAGGTLSFLILIGLGAFAAPYLLEMMRAISQLQEASSYFPKSP